MNGMPISRFVARIGRDALRLVLFASCSAALSPAGAAASPADAGGPASGYLDDRRALDAGGATGNPIDPLTALLRHLGTDPETLRTWAAYSG